MNLEELRADILERPLEVSELGSDPFHILKSWIKDVVDAGIPQANAMSISTVDQDSKPHSRVVLLKEVEGEKLTFYTNYDSPKGQDLSKNSNIAINFHWFEVARQVRIEGTVSKSPREKSKAYFLSRPYDSQIAAAVSKQGMPVESREALEKEFMELKQEKTKESMDCPHFWGGYDISPVYFEFWQSRSNRLHDRIFYSKSSKGWETGRLYP